ncbi:tetratricopeptide repeat protein [bacterium]|nr:tetratricopeptide repeat protein [bacterium]
MRSRKIFTLMAMTVALGMLSCGGGSGKGDYDKLITEGETLFASGDYTEALAAFEDARDADPDKAEIYSAIGWCYIQLSNITAASNAFSDGADKTNAPADLFAGWAFVLSAGKSYAAANTEIGVALALDSDWEFTYGLGLDVSDLRVLKASNHFVLGEFTQSLAEVKILDSGFNANVATPAGLASLSQKIESLKTQFGKRRS